MSTKRTSPTLKSLLSGESRIRQIEHQGENWYAVADIVAALTESAHPLELWNDLKQREPNLASLVESAELPNPETGLPETLDMVTTTGLLRLVQSIPSPRADRIKMFLAQTVQEALAEADDPELAVMRARRLYEHKGYSRQWIDSRLSTVSARQDLAGEWYRRGARESDQFRELTNELFKSAFGMDVNNYRQFKRLHAPGENLRDHMTDLELALTRRAEITAAALHRDRNSRSFEHLMRDVHEAGSIAARTRGEIESRRGKPVTYPGSFAA